MNQLRVFCTNRSDRVQSVPRKCVFPNLRTKNYRRPHMPVGGCRIQSAQQQKRTKNAQNSKRNEQQKTRIQNNNKRMETDCVSSPSESSQQPTQQPCPIDFGQVQWVDLQEDVNGKAKGVFNMEGRELLSKQLRTVCCWLNIKGVKMSRRMR